MSERSSDLARGVVFHSLDAVQGLQERLKECRDWMERAADCLDARNFDQAQWMAGHLRKQADYNRAALEKTRAWRKPVEAPQVVAPGEEPF